MSAPRSFRRIVLAAAHRVGVSFRATWRRRHLRQTRPRFVPKTGLVFFDEGHFATYIHGGRPHIVLPLPVAAERGVVWQGQGRAADPSHLPRRNAAMLTRVSRPSWMLAFALLAAGVSLSTPLAAQSLTQPSIAGVSYSDDFLSPVRHQQPDRERPLAGSFWSLGRSSLALRRSPPRTSGRCQSDRPIRHGSAPLQPRTALRRPQLPRSASPRYVNANRSNFTATCSAKIGTHYYTTPPWTDLFQRGAQSLDIALAG